MAKNTANTVQALQEALSQAAKQSLTRTFGALYDKIYRPDVLTEAWKRVRANQGAPGVDRLSIKQIEQEIGVGRFLLELEEDLRQKTYRPEAVLRCWIAKPGKSERRPLGIPIIRDRVVQAATKLVIEPIFETNFVKHSYGFRPRRSQHMALVAIREAITFKHQSVVIDADLKGYFDSIPHNLLLRLVKRRISDRRVVSLIRAWLKAGVMEDRRLLDPTDCGSPQGGVISPLLSNIFLHSFDKMFEQSGIHGTLVRYADDFVILLPSNINAEVVLQRVKMMLKRLQLTLHPTKTRIVSAEVGFDFLGVHFRRCPTRSARAGMRYVTRLWPSNQSMQSIRQKIRELTREDPGSSLEAKIARLVPVLRGWNRYHTVIRPVRQRLLQLNAFVRDRLRIFLKRKYSDPTRGAWRTLDNLFVRLGLFQCG